MNLKVNIYRNRLVGFHESCQAAWLKSDPVCPHCKGENIIETHIMMTMFTPKSTRSEYTVFDSKMDKTVEAIWEV